MLSGHEEKLRAIRDICISVGTQVLHIHHIMHGLDPLTIRKADMLTAYAKFIWDNHTFEDFKHFAPDLIINRLKRSDRVMNRYSSDMSGILTSLVDSSTAGINKKEAEQVNHDYEIAVEAIQKASEGKLDDVNLNELKNGAGHVDFSELSHSSEVDDIVSVHEELHSCAVDEYEKRKAFEERIHTAYQMMHKK